MNTRQPEPGKCPHCGMTKEVDPNEAMVMCEHRDKVSGAVKWIDFFKEDIG